MKPTLAIGLLGLGLAAGAVSVSPRSTATAADLATYSVPDIHPGDKVRLCLDRSRSGEVSWVGGTVRAVDHTHVSIVSSVTDANPFEGNGNGATYTRQVERWVPTGSILYIEKLISESMP